MTLQDIEHELAAFTESEFSGGASEADVQEAENALGVHFPFQYRQFLLHFGSGFASSEEFVGLGGPSHLNVVWLTNKLRGREGGFPSWLIPIHTDGYGNYDCLDITRRDQNGECPVIQWLHDGGTNPSYAVLGASFNEWLITLLRSTKKLDEDVG
jgi:cell wall assembly regulator SMI1